MNCDDHYIDRCTSAGSFVTSCTPRAATSCTAGAPPAPDSGLREDCHVSCTTSSCDPANLRSLCTAAGGVYNDGDRTCTASLFAADCTTLRADYNAPPSGSTPTNSPVVGPGGSRGAPAPTLPNPLGGTTDVRTIIARVINAALGISGSLALLMFIWGGMLWLTSGGSPERIQKGKNTIVWAVLGLVLIFGSYAILNFVLGTILGTA